MSVAQTKEFRSRVERIEKNNLCSKRAFMRDRFGMILVHKPKKNRHRIMAILRIVILIFITISVLKAVLIHNDDNGQYTNIIARLDAIDGQFDFLSMAAAPDYLTEPIGNFFNELASKIEPSK